MSTHSSHGDEEIDREPEPSISEGGEDVEHEEEAPNDPAIQPATTHHAPTKINLKLITMEPFTGEVRDGYFDAGAHEWFERLQAQIEDAENLNGLSWSEQLKCSVLTSRLVGAAGTWRIRNRGTLPKNSFRDLGHAFLQKFRSRLSVQRLSILLAGATKLPLESYDEYAHRLSQIATGLNQGRVSNYTEQQALSTFVNLAYPHYRDTLLTQVNVEADDASEEMETAINLLSRLAGNDGRMRKRHYDTGSGSRTGSANAGVSSNNSKKQRWDFSNALCRTCNQRGHTTNYHDRFVAQQQRGQPEHSTTGMAAAAAQPSDEK
ncbi:hypothetical protein F443_16294 [Phytophthora nicotianae P1569]|uniref:Retrotransposon gag domain-containing protein n=1 Tax=Phytophthora nicotianae P1569 TaxID=1317065 RepID=V9EF85_PHYNI|nr:hypothetical protein F443_16294 [Phytophthora nicotianae P1569]